MLSTRKLHAHGELYWWLILVTLATALMSVLAREARGEPWGQSGLRPPACSTRSDGPVATIYARRHEQPMESLRREFAVQEKKMASAMVRIAEARKGTGLQVGVGLLARLEQRETGHPVDRFCCVYHAPFSQLNGTYRATSMPERKVLLAAGAKNKPHVAQIPLHDWGRRGLELVRPP